MSVLRSLFRRFDSLAHSASVPAQRLLAWPRDGLCAASPVRPEAALLLVWLLFTAFLGVLTLAAGRPELRVFLALAAPPFFLLVPRRHPAFHFGFAPSLALAGAGLWYSGGLQAGPPVWPVLLVLALLHAGLGMIGLGDRWPPPHFTGSVRRPSGLVIDTWEEVPGGGTPDSGLLR